MQEKQSGNITDTSRDSDFERVVDMAPYPILIHNAGVIKYLNKLSQEVLGFDSKEEALGRNLAEFVLPEDKARLIEAIKAGMVNRDSVSPLSVKFKNNKGRLLTVQTNSSAIVFRGEDCRLVFTTDYDEKQRVEEELVNKSLLIEKIAEIIPDSFIVVDNQTREVVFENKSLTQILGYTPADIGDKDVFAFILEIIHKDDIKKLVEARKFLNEPDNIGQYISTEYRLKDKEGKWRWILSRSTMFRPLDRPGHQINFGIAQDITHQKEIERQLEESKIFAEKVAGTVPNHISIFDLDEHTVVFNNFYFGELLGYSKEERPGNVLAFFPDEFKEEAAKLFEHIRTLKDGEIFTRITPFLTKEGKTKYLLTRLTPFLRNEEGNITQVLSTTIDVNDIKEKENELQLSKRIYRNIAESLPNGSVVVFDKNLNFTHAEGPLLERQKIKKEDIIGTNARTGNTDAGGWGYFLPYFEKTLKGESFDLEVPQKDYFYKIVIKPLYDSNGSIYGGMSITLDLKDTKDAQIALTRSEEKRKAILFALPDLVFQVDIGGLVTDFYANEIYRIEMEKMDFVGKRIDRFVPGADAENVMDIVRKVVETDNMEGYEYVHYDNASATNFHYEMRVSKLNNNEAIIIVRDVSNLRSTREQLDLRLKELSDKNIQLEKYIASNSELEKFAYIASHDLREPIRSIVGFAQLLQKRLAAKLDDDENEFVNTIIDSAQRMNSLVHGLLDYSRITSAAKPMQKVDVNGVLKKVLSDLGATVDESKAEIIVFNLPEVVCDELQIRQLFQNLISNSIKFRKQNERPVVKISAEKKDNEWMFTVEDNGIGVDMRYKEKVFEIFTRLPNHEKIQGTGIGLALCKRIIERHGGNIWLESKQGVGTTMHFSIPD
jgi:PAS domain S-box-containing protein